MTQDRHKEYMFSTDAFMTPQMERKAEETGVRKGEMGWRNTFALSILAGAFIATLPSIIVFVFTKRFIVRGIATQGLRG